MPCKYQQLWKRSPQNIFHTTPGRSACLFFKYYQYFYICIILSKPLMVHGGFVIWFFEYSWFSYSILHMIELPVFLLPQLCSGFYCDSLFKFFRWLEKFWSFFILVKDKIPEKDLLCYERKEYLLPMQI